MKPLDIKSETYNSFNQENNYWYPKFKIDSYVRISKYKTIFAKGYVPNCSEGFLLLKKLKILCRGHI